MWKKLFLICSLLSGCAVAPQNPGLKIYKLDPDNHLLTRVQAHEQIEPHKSINGDAWLCERSDELEAFLKYLSAKECN